MSEQPAGGFGRLQEEILARLNELMHSLREVKPLCRRRAEPTKAQGPEHRS